MTRSLCYTHEALTSLVPHERLPELPVIGVAFHTHLVSQALSRGGHLMRRVDSLEKTLMLGGIGGRRKRGRQRIRWLDGITDSMDMSLCKLREIVKDSEAWRAVFHEVTKSQRLSLWHE